VNQKTFFVALVTMFATVVALSVGWEFWFEDWLFLRLDPAYEPESHHERWEYVTTVAVFSLLALVGPAVIGARIIRRDETLRDQVVRLSREDYLTGLDNRRRSTEVLENEIRRATRYKTTFSLILADIDHFKSVNDRLGHQAGDRVLASIASNIRATVRATDRVGRWGGEEFIIISPETDIGGGAALAEKIRTKLEWTDFGKIGHRTASFGVTAFRDGDNMESVTARADDALYAAKQGGRNRVEVAAMPTETVSASRS
jgi:diguanylate cyclase (GGDEF)-like protein